MLAEEEEFPLFLVIYPLLVVVVASKDTIDPPMNESLKMMPDYETQGDLTKTEEREEEEKQRGSLSAKILNSRLKQMEEKEEEN